MSGGGFKVWDAETGMPIHTLRGHSGASAGAAFSPDGTLIATSSGVVVKPGEVKIWDATTGRELRNLPGATWIDSRVVFSPDGMRVAAVSGMSDKAGLLTIWDVKTGTQLRQLPSDKGEMGLIDLAFSPDGNHIATASGHSDVTSTEDGPGVVKIRDSWTGIEILSLRGHQKPLI